MKHNIIKTDNYLLIVDDSEITGWYFDSYTNKIRHSGGAEYGENSITKNIICHLPLNNYPILDGVPLLPPLEYEDDVEKMAHCEYPVNLQPNGRTLAGGKYDVDINYDGRAGFISGFKKSKEKYKYTEEDMRKAMRFGGMRSKLSIQELDDAFQSLIQSLSQPKMPIGFEYIDTITTDEGTYPEWVGEYIYEGGSNE